MAKTQRSGSRVRSAAARSSDEDVNPQWTVMVYMGADAIEQDFPLALPAIDDIQEMGIVGSTATLKLYVQVRGVDSVPRRAEVKEHTLWADIVNDENTVVPSEQRDTRDGHALEAFILDALGRSGHSHSNRQHYTMLVLWGHAYDFGIDRTPTAAGGADALNYTELSTLLQRMQTRLQKQLKMPEAPRLDIVAFDACDAATLELALELAPFAHFMLGSQIGVPIPGFPYDRILSRLAEPCGRLMAPPEFGLWAVRRFAQSYAPFRTVSLSMLNLDRAVEVAARAKVLADALAAAVDADPSAGDVLSSLFEDSQTLVDRPYIDLADLCLNLTRTVEDTSLAAIAGALGDALIEAPPGVAGHSEEAASYPFIVAQGRNSAQTARLNGVSLYAPFETTDDAFGTGKAQYETFTFARSTRWSSLVHRLAGLA